MKNLVLILIILFSIQENERLINLITKTTNSNHLVTIYKTFYNTKTATIFDNTPTINPLNPEKIKRNSSNFGNRFHPISGEYKKHLGIDLVADKNLAVHVVGNGVVSKIVFNNSNKGYGNYIEVVHLYGFKTRYAHLDKIFVKKDQILLKAQIIGTVGTTGSSTGNHLHYEIIKNNIHIDPLLFLDL